MFQRILLAIFSVLILGCPSKKAPLQSAPQVQIQLPVKPLEKSSEDLHLQLLMQALSDMDAIYRELIRIAFDQKESDLSLFYKLQRAIASDVGIKISSLSRLGCERYTHRYFPDKKNWQNLEVQEVCLKNPVTLLTVQKISAERFQIKISSEPLQRLLGLKATLAFTEAHCELKTQNGRLNQFSCERLAHEKPASDWVLLIQSLRGQQAEKNFQAELKGQLLENLAPLRKFEMLIPNAGPLRVTETELFPAEPDPTQVASPVLQVPPETKTPSNSVNPGQPLNLNEQEYQKWISGEPVIADQPGVVPGKDREVPPAAAGIIPGAATEVPTNESGEAITGEESSKADAESAGDEESQGHGENAGTDSSDTDGGIDANSESDEPEAAEEEAPMVMGEPELPSQKSNQGKER